MSSRHDRKRARMGELADASSQIRERNDCVVRALAIVFDCDYEEVHWLLKRKGRKHRKGTYWDSQTLPAIRTLEREVSHRDVLLVRVRRHVLAVRNGLVYDWTSGRCHRIDRIFRLVKNPDRQHTF